MTNNDAATTTLPARDEIDPKYQWNLADMFPSDADWESEFESLTAEIARIADFRGMLGRSADQLLAWMQFADALHIRLGKLGNYAFRKYDEDTVNNQYQQYMSKTMSVHATAEESTSWVVPELLAISNERIHQFIDEEPGLALYWHALDEILRLKPHTLPEEQERLLALAQETSSAPGMIFGMFNDADISFPSISDENGNLVELTKGRYIQFQESQSRELRRDAFTAMYGEYRKWRNTLAATLSGQIKQSIFHAKARNYPSTRAAALYGDNIPLHVYENVVSSMNNNLAPLHRATELRRRILEVETVKPWDLYVPLTKDKAHNYSYENAVALMDRFSSALGEEYRSDMMHAFSDGWIDVFENKGKHSGAYSSWTYGSHPFILLNYSDTLKDVFTLAHELGHSMHSFYTWKNQPPVYGGYTIFCAEVASTCNEILLLDHMLASQPPDDLKLHLLLHHIDTIRGTVYNQALFAEFEMTIHNHVEQGQPLTADYLDEVMDSLYRRYYGPAFDSDPLYATNWARIPHFYRSFYVFQYATGFSAAAALAKQILEEGPPARARYLDFLKSGSSEYSIELLQKAGVDMTAPGPIEASASLMNDLLDEVEALVS